MKISRRHKKGIFRTRVVNKIDLVSEQAWNRVFPDVLEGYRFYKTLDESNFHQFSFCYILVYEGKQLVGVAPCFSVDYSLDTSINGPLRRLTNVLKLAAPKLLSIKALVCGVPMSQGQIGIAGDPHAVLEAILRRMEQLARKMRAPILAFKDFNQSYTTVLKPLGKSGFLKVDSLPSTELALSFSNFEKYLKTLSGATRYDLRRKFKKASAAKIERTIVDTLDEKTLTDVYRLYRQIINKHEMTFEILPQEFFKLISRNMPHQVKYFLWKIDGKLVAFLLCFVSDNLLIDCFLGLDYAVAYEHHLYFVKFKDVMNWCFTHGIKKYEMGVSGYEPKRRLGFDFVPLYLYIKIRYRWLRPFLKGLCVLLKFENFDPELKKWRRGRTSQR